MEPKQSPTGMLVLAFTACLGANEAVAQVVVSPLSPIFSAEQYSSSAIRSVTVKNAATTSLDLGAITFTGADAGDFAVASDGCSNHVIDPQKSCKIRLQFDATQPAHSTETATLDINDSSGVALAAVALSGDVVKREVSASITGLTVTLSNATQFEYDLSETIDGPFFDTGNGSCTILTGTHGEVHPKPNTCTIILGRTGPGSGDISIDVIADLDGGKSYSFDIPLE